MMAKERLTEKDYWDTHPKPGSQPQRTRRTGGLKSKIAGRYFDKIKDGYQRYLLYDVECPRVMPPGKLKVIEIGSAPGRELIALYERFDCEPYGVEYTESGVELNRQLFAEHGIDQDNVVHSDFFDEAFQQKYREQFDVVMSHGFIEHFTDLQDVIDKHTNLLKPNGILFITVPNMRWFNYLLLRFFAPEAIKAHNLKIMRKETLRSYFKPVKHEVLRCKYLGTLNFGMIYGQNKPPFKLMLMNLLMNMQGFIDATLYLLCKNGCIESRLFSPKLMIISRKK